MSGNVLALDLLANAAATGAAMTWSGGDGCFLAVGSFGGATVSLQVLGPDRTTWIDVGASTTLSAQGVATYRLPPGQIRAAVTGGTPSGLYAKAAGIGQ